MARRESTPRAGLSAALAVVLLVACVTAAAPQDPGESSAEEAARTFDRLALEPPAAAQQLPSPGLGIDPERVVGPPRGVPLLGLELDRTTRELAAVMRCVACQGLSVADSPAPAALAMKAEIRELLGAGYTPAQTLAYFESAYGEFIRLVPRARGFNLVVWVAPLLGLVAGLALLLRRLGRHANGPSDDTLEELEGYRARVRREVSS